MHSTITSAALIGLGCLSVVSAAPFSFPLQNNFPTVANPSSQLTEIEVLAHGSLPNGGAPPTPQADSLTSLRLIAFNELFEVAFFTELIANITNDVPGYMDLHGWEKQKILDILTQVQNQEELHALNANGALTKFTGTPILPCKYNFPVTNFGDAIALASTFTDVVLGTLQDVVSLFGTDGDSALIRGVASVIGQEGEQNGFYRELLDKVPSALPFLTTSTRDFAFSALNQNFIVPGSCPSDNFKTIDLKIFLPLTVTTQNIQPSSQNLQFSLTIPSGYTPDAPWGSQYENLVVVYINQQNTPVVEKPQNVHIGNGVATFEAAFPFNGTTFGNGLTIAALAPSNADLTTADAVAKVAIAGPGLIEIN